jgi:hypothetical protein
MRRQKRGRNGKRDFVTLVLENMCWNKYLVLVFVWSIFTERKGFNLDDPRKDPSKTWKWV